MKFLTTTLCLRFSHNMSDRLRILPKKSYCPWKPENVERILRDEREHREAQAAAELSERKRRSQRRIDELKDSKKDSSNDVVERFSLFRKEEEQAKLAALHGTTTEKATGATRNNGVMPLFLSNPSIRAKDASSRSLDFTTMLSSSVKGELLHTRDQSIDKEEHRKKKLDPENAWKFSSADFDCNTQRDASLSGDSSGSGIPHSRRAGRKDARLDYGAHYSQRRKLISQTNQHKTRKRKRERLEKSRKKSRPQLCSIEDLRKRRWAREQREGKREDTISKI